MRLTRELEPPYERVMGKDYVYTSDTRLTQSFASVEQKLGQYEDIDDDPKHLEKVKKALEIIKESIPIEEEDFFYDSEFDTYLFIGHKVSKEQFYLLNRVLFDEKEN